MPRLFGTPTHPATQSDSIRDPYRGVVIFLLAGAVLGAVGSLVGGLRLANRVLLDVAITLGVAAGVLVGVAMAQAERARPPRRVGENANSGPQEEVTPAVSEGEAPPPPDLWPATDGRNEWNTRSALSKALAAVAGWYEDLGPMGRDAAGTAAAGMVAIILVLTHTFPYAVPLTAVGADIAAGAFLAAAGVAALAARYLANVDPAKLPEGPGLCRGARVVAWLLVLAAPAVALEWAQQHLILRFLHFVFVAVNAAVCISLFPSRRASDEGITIFPLDLGPVSMLGSRPNVMGSVLDAAQRQLGIDLRSTWALTVVRRGLEPLAIGLLFLGWMSTSVTVVGIEEQGLVERLGVPVAGQPLAPGLHIHWPWPVDQVFRIPVQRIQAVEIGHGGEEAPGPENVLWAVKHAENEYTLLLGNGRDLITVDAAVQFLILDARAWRYHCQNPRDALTALAYRAVMRNTVDRTLSDALSENIATVAEQMRAMVQRDADSLGLGIKVVGFTVGGMHPPVPVASSYEGVISAEIRKVTAVVDAQVFRNQTLPAAEASALMSENGARADAAEALAEAAGAAWSFRTLESEYRAAPEEYMFRRRLETLEQGLAGHPFTVVDARFLRDGGEVWINP